MQLKKRHTFVTFYAKVLHNQGNFFVCFVSSLFASNASKCSNTEAELFTLAIKATAHMIISY